MTVPKKILVTGASGFIGRNLCASLRARGYFVRVAIRNNMHDVFGADEYIEISDVGLEADWAQALIGIDVVIHLAARVHVVKESAADSLEVFRKVNVLGTKRLAEQSVKAGVKRFFFMSSIGVNGEVDSGKPFAEQDTPCPVSAYAISKWEAEQILCEVVRGTGMEIVIFRPTLVYGPSAPGNFARLMRLVKLKAPLPFGGFKNLRSFLYVGNLVDAIITCMTHPRAVGETFLLSDGEDVSTPDLIQMIAVSMNKKVVLFPFPQSVLKTLCKIIGKDKELEKLTGNLTVDCSKIRNLLGWKPPFTMEEGIRESI
ncbi:MAG: SDR family oxidoreductase [Candidatus Omnitrophica bacterium]|nr:SDR family oxidoreductase [Candidatus Omnitrophota bacterium]